MTSRKYGLTVTCFVWAQVSGVDSKHAIGLGLVKLFSIILFVGKSIQNHTLDILMKRWVGSSMSEAADNTFFVTPVGSCACGYKP